MSVNSAIADAPPVPLTVCHVPSSRKYFAAEPSSLGRKPWRSVVALFVVTSVRASAPSASVPPPAELVWLCPAFAKLAMVGVVRVLFARVPVPDGVT
jgi:hypothetical protein